MAQEWAVVSRDRLRHPIWNPQTQEIQAFGPAKRQVCACLRYADVDHLSTC
jgi:hypothetical protein